MILTFFRNLENQKNQSKKKNKALTQSTNYNAVILLNARKKFLMLLKVESFHKENQANKLQAFQIAWLDYKSSPTVRSLTVSSLKY